MTSQDEDYIYTNSLSFGVGVGIPMGGDTRLYADYGYRTVEDFFDDTQMFSVRMGF